MAKRLLKSREPRHQEPAGNTLPYDDAVLDLPFVKTDELRREDGSFICRRMVSWWSPPIDPKRFDWDHQPDYEAERELGRQYAEAVIPLVRSSFNSNLLAQIAGGMVANNTGTAYVIFCFFERISEELRGGRGDGFEAERMRAHLKLAAE